MAAFLTIPTMSGNEITSDQCKVHRVADPARKAVRDLLDDHEILHDDVAEIQIHRDLASGTNTQVSERILDRSERVLRS